MTQSESASERARRPVRGRHERLDLELDLIIDAGHLAVDDLVADATTIGATAFARIAPTERIDDLVTDPAADPSALEELRAAGVQVHLADLRPTAQEADQP